MPWQPDKDDPFYGGEKVPSLSWRDLPEGSTFTLEIVEPAKSLQSRDFATGELAFWDAEHTRPVMSAVLNVQVLDGPHSPGELRSIWAQIPSNMFIALKEAQKDAQAPFAPGGILQVRYTGSVPHDNPHFNAIKQYVAKYTPPPSASSPDPFATTPTPGPTQPSLPTAARPAPAPGTAPRASTTTKKGWGA
jgi:hypothetical protein